MRHLFVVFFEIGRPVVVGPPPLGEVGPCSPSCLGLPISPDRVIELVGLIAYLPRAMAVPEERIRQGAQTFAAKSSQFLLHRILLSLLASLFIAGCTTIAPFDRVAYEKATDAKAAALTVMSRGVNSYTSEKDAVTPLIVRVEEAYEYDRGRPLNSDTVKMWEILMNPEGRLYGRFLRRWQEGLVNAIFTAVKF
jgi:hypothetical protein